jgi:tripartite-type tricarboxylate transporter receptor subunit TctC
VRIVVPFGPGGPADVYARVIGQQLTEVFKQQFVIENKPGAGAVIGTDIVAKAAPDGYTMGLITASTHALAPALGAKLPYDTVKDFKPVSMIFDAPYALVLYPGIPAKTVKDLVALAKEQPGKLNYGSAGLASLAHLAGALFATQTGISLTHVPYRSSAQSSVDLMTGRLDMQFATVAPTLANIRDGKLNALATTGIKRVAALPQVPTMIEAGVSDYDVSLWAAYAMPAGTPDEIVAKLNAEMRAILTDAATVEALRKQGFEPIPGPPDAVSKRARSEIEKWRALVAKAGIKVE